MGACLCVHTCVKAKGDMRHLPQLLSTTVSEAGQLSAAGVTVWMEELLASQSSPLPLCIPSAVITALCEGTQLILGGLGTQAEVSRLCT